MSHECCGCAVGTDEAIAAALKERDAARALAMNAEFRAVNLLAALEAVLPIAVERMDWLHGEWPDVLRDSQNVLVRLAAMTAISKARGES